MNADISLWIGAAALFVALSIATKGLAAVAAFRSALPEVAKNVGLWFCNTLLSRVLGLAVLGAALSPLLRWEIESVWANLAIAFVALELIDYWLHRFRHTRMVWPLHRVHHSDRAMSWTTIHRKHPGDHIVTYIGEIAFLALLGVPLAFALAVAFVRGLYIAFVHADLPWSLGPLRYVLISPLAHRYHHALDERLAGSNFGGVLSIWDRMFGTYAEPDHRADTGVPRTATESWLARAARAFGQRRQFRGSRLVTPVAPAEPVSSRPLS